MGKQPDPIPSLMARLRRIEEWMRRKDSSTPFFGTGLHPNGSGGLDSDNYAAGSSGYSFKNDGNAEFNDLTLRGGIIGNDALTEPVKIVQAHDDADNFSVPTGSGAQVMSVTIPVPSGYSQALLMITASASATNTTAGADYLYTNRKITGYTIGGWQIGSATTPAGDTGVSYDATSISLTGLPSSLTITGWVSSAFGNWSATSTNVANLDAMVIFLR